MSPATLERIAAEFERTEPQHPVIRISGERSGLDTCMNLDRSEALEQVRRMKQESGQPNYSELVLEQYRRLQALYEAVETGDDNQDIIDACLCRIEELERLEREQVKEILDARLTMPLGTEDELRSRTEELLRKYGDSPSTT